MFWMFHITGCVVQAATRAEEVALQKQRALEQAQKDEQKKKDADDSEDDSEDDEDDEAISAVARKLKEKEG